MIYGWDNAPLADIVTDGAKHVTFIYPFYRNVAFLIRQLDSWMGYPEELRKYISAIIVDDGSPPFYDAEYAFSQYFFRPFPIRLFKIEIDIRFNWLAARNIGMKFAPEGWCVGTDMDHMVPVETAQALVHGAHDERCIYRFSRMEHTGEHIHPHPNSWFMTRKMFWKFGGYDEALSGYYGTDGEARRRWVKTAPVYTLKDHLVRYEYVDDSSTKLYKRKQPEDLRAQQLIKQRPKDWKPKVLSFPFHEVHLNA